MQKLMTARNINIINRYRLFNNLPFLFLYESLKINEPNDWKEGTIHQAE